MNVSTKDSWINTEHGTLFTRSWHPGSASEQAEHSPIVLFHDSLGCVELWRGFPAVLAECAGRVVIAYDRLGFGQSDRRTDILGADFIQNEAKTFFPLVCSHLGLDTFVAFGHSVGGGMAAHCAAMYPAACVALVTESAQAFVEDRTRAGILAAKEQFRQPGALERLQRYHGEKTSWVLDAWTETWLSPAFANWSLRKVLPEVRCPTLVIHGNEDEYGSSKHAEQIAGLVTGPSELELMPGVRHVPHREQEQWIASRVARFLERLTK